MSWSDDSSDAKLESTADKISQGFESSQLWEFEQFLGNGAFGVVFLLREKNPILPFNERRVVLKRPIREDEGVDDLLKEIEALTLLRGSFHIVQLLASCEDVTLANSTSSQLGILGPPLNAIFSTLRETRLKGPALLLEYLENGSLSKFIFRATVYRATHGRTITLPNRLLWSFYFCLVRACIAMAYPPNAPEDSPLVIETISPDKEPIGISHGDVASRNIMMGDRDPAGPAEHHLVPTLKLIDFGRLRITNDRVGPVIAENISDVSAEILDLICMNTRSDRMVMEYLVHNGIRTMAEAIVPQPDINNPFPHLDHELRDLVIHGMAVNPRDRPSLEEMLRRTEQGMQKPASSYVGREAEESNGSVEEVIQALVFNA